MLNRAMKTFRPASREASAHCDGPCGVYDPSSARIAAEAVLQLTNKALGLEAPDPKDAKAYASYLNTLTRYITIKEEQAHLAKEELLVLWTDYFKPPHLEKYPDLHEKFWNAAKLCSACKQELNPQKCEQLLDAIKEIHDIFWATKDRKVEWFRAS